MRGEWDDLKQEIQARVLRNLTGGYFKGRSALRTYVHRISKNVAIDFGRKAYRQREVAIDPADPRSAARLTVPGENEAQVRRDVLDRILEQLSVEDRTLLHLVFELQYSYQEVSHELGISEGTVKSKMSRCKDRVLRLRRDLVAQD